MIIYVLTDKDSGPITAHTTEQGATEEMAKFAPARQQYTTVNCIELIDDHDP